MSQTAWLLVAVAFGALSIGLIIELMQSAERRRVVLQRLTPPTVRRDDGLAELFRAEERQEAPLPALLAGMPGLREAARLLRQAGLDWSTRFYAGLIIGSAAFFGLLTWLFGHSLVLALVITALAALLPGVFVRQRKRRRLRAFEEQFPDAVDLLSRAIRAGHPLSAGVRMVAEEASMPIAGEFAKVFEQNRFGLPFEDALLGLAYRNDLVDVRIFVTAILIQREVGGNLAEILDKIGQTVRARFAVQRQLRVHTAQGRLSGTVLAVMPLVMAAGLFLADRQYASMLWTEPVGRAMVGGALLLQIIGFIWIRRIVGIEI